MQARTSLGFLSTQCTLDIQDHADCQVSFTLGSLNGITTQYNIGYQQHFRFLYRGKEQGLMWAPLQACYCNKKQSSAIPSSRQLACNIHEQSSAVLG